MYYSNKASERIECANSELKLGSGTVPAPLVVRARVGDQSDVLRSRVGCSQHRGEHDRASAKTVLRVLSLPQMRQTQRPNRTRDIATSSVHEKTFPRIRGEGNQRALARSKKGSERAFVRNLYICNREIEFFRIVAIRKFRSGGVLRRHQGRSEQRQPGEDFWCDAPVNSRR